MSSRLGVLTCVSRFTGVSRYLLLLTDPRPRLTASFECMCLDDLDVAFEAILPQKVWLRRNASSWRHPTEVGGN